MGNNNPTAPAQPENPNLQIFNFARTVPAHCKKEIKGGPLKGYTNISPQWRLEKLTELFGPVGFGWVIENIKYWTSEGAGECVMWCSLDLKVCWNGAWSLPINGIGGSKLYGKGKGDGINDEACKMAQTDALSVACKNLGFASDVYYGLDDTKYRDGKDDFQWGIPPQPPPPPGQPVAPAPPQPQPAYQQPAPPPAPAQPAPAPAPQPPVQQPQPQQQEALFPQQPAAPAAAAPAPAPAPVQQQGPIQVTLEQAIQLATNAQSREELVKLWNDFKKLYGTNTAFKKAIADNPNNPSKK